MFLSIRVLVRTQIELFATLGIAAVISLITQPQVPYGALGAVVCAIAIYIRWMYRYRFFFKLYHILEGIAKHVPHCTLKSNFTQCRIFQDGTVFHVSFADKADAKMRTSLTVGRDFFDEITHKAEHTVSSRHFGPLRGTYDRTIFKDWCDYLEHLNETGSLMRNPS